MALYGKVDYWDERYRDTETAGPYDWYQSYQTLRHLLSVQALMAATKLDSKRPFPSWDKCRVLILGCGNSTFGEDMRQDGWEGPITNLDFSSVVVHQMEEKYRREGHQPPPMSFVCADITEGLPFRDQSFDLIICKGTFDAILCCAGSMAKAKNVVKECSRVLTSGHGVLFLVTHGNPDSRIVFLEHENDLSFYWQEVSMHNLGRKSKGNGKCDYIYICRKRLENIACTDTECLDHGNKVGGSGEV